MTAGAVTPLDAVIEAHRARIEAALVARLPGPPAVPALLHEAMRYSLVAGGKRLRPVLTLLAAEAVAPDDAAVLDRVLPAACAIEWVHTYSLIHDDLPAMDNDTLRRGRPTSHMVYGDGLAILAGDALLTEAFQLLARTALEVAAADAGRGARTLRAIALVARAAGAAGMVGGQVLDLEAAGQCHAPDVADVRPRRLEAHELRAMHAKKTGALIQAAVVCGAILAGASDEEERALSAFGTELGLAFQIVDDILDVEGEAATLGKTAGKDAAAGKPTYPALFGLEASHELAEAAAARAIAALEPVPHSMRLAELARWVVRRTS